MSLVIAAVEASLDRETRISIIAQSVSALSDEQKDRLRRHLQAGSRLCAGPDALVFIRHGDRRFSVAAAANHDNPLLATSIPVAWQVTQIELLQASGRRIESMEDIDGEPIWYYTVAVQNSTPRQLRAAIRRGLS